jgi:transposase
MPGTSGLIKGHLIRRVLENSQIKTLEREVKELRRANEILRLASAFFAQAELDRRFKS